MKKFVFICLFVFSTLNLFAQNSKYSELYNKGQQYESQKKWTYALGTYFDAIAEDPFNSKTAYDRINEITASIRDGNPGIGTYKGLNLFNSWKELLIETEQYWNEYCPFVFSVSTPELKDVKKTSADYTSTINYQHSEKYFIIMKAITIGYYQAYQSSWSLPAEWPKNSASTGKFEKTVEYNNDKIYPPSINSAEFLNNSVATFAGDIYYDDTSKWDRQSNTITYYSNTKGFNTLYNAFTLPALFEVHIKLVTKDGKTVISQNSLTLGNYLYIGNILDEYVKTDFKNLTLSQAKLIDDDKVNVIIDSVSLHYGTSETQIKITSVNNPINRVKKNVQELPSTKYALTKTNLFSNQKLILSDPYTWYYIHKLSDKLLNISKENESINGHTEIADVYATDDLCLSSYYYNLDDYIKLPLWKVAEFLNHTKGLPSCYNKTGELISKKGFYVDKSDNEYRLIHNVEYTKEYKEKQIDDLIATANKELESLKIIFTVLDYEEYDYQKHSQTYQVFVELRNNLTNAVKSRDYQALSYQTLNYNDQLEGNSYANYVSSYNTIQKKAEYVKSTYPSLKTKQEEISNELLNDETSKKQLNSFQAILDKYSTIDDTIPSQARFKNELSKINYSTLEQNLKKYKSSITSTEPVLKELKDKILYIENKLSEYKITDDVITTSLTTAKEAVKSYEDCISNKTYHDLTKLSSNVSSNNNSLKTTVDSVNKKITEIKEINSLKETLKNDTETKKNLLNEYKTKLASYPSDKDVTDKINEIEELLSKSDNNTLNDKTGIIKLNNKINLISFSSFDSYIEFQNELIKLNKTIQTKSELILTDCKLKLSQIPDKSESSIFQIELTSIKNKVSKIKNEKYTDIALCNSKIQELENTNFKTLDDMIKNYNKGLKTLSEIGLTLVPDSKLSTASSPAYELVAEKKSLAAKAKLKGTIILQNSTYNNFIITIGKNAGNTFIFKTTKQDIEIVLP